MKTTPWRTPRAAKTKRRFPEKGDHSNVNNHHKSKHRLRGVAGAVKAGKQKQASGNIQRSLEAIKNSFAESNRCVCDVKLKICS